VDFNVGIFIVATVIRQIYLYYIKSRPSHAPNSLTLTRSRAGIRYKVCGIRALQGPGRQRPKPLAPRVCCQGLFPRPPSLPSHTRAWTLHRKDERFIATSNQLRNLFGFLKIPKTVQYDRNFAPMALNTQIEFKLVARWSSVFRSHTIVLGVCVMIGSRFSGPNSWGKYVH
jgi:hypothetical protein